MQRVHLIQLLSMISLRIPITFIDNIMKLLYVIFFFNLFIIQTQVCIFWMLFLLGPALKLWLDKKMYTVERLIQTCYGCLYYLGVRIIRVSILS